MSGLVSHLERRHGATDGHRLAKVWRTNKTKKKYYACGFCVCYFHTLKEQLNHIEMQHWSRFQGLGEWKSNNVILSLVRQPGVLEEWKQLLARYNVPKDTKLSWRTSKIEDLQRRLEQGVDLTTLLAELAFTQSSYYLDYRAEIEPPSMEKEYMNKQSYEDHMFSTMTPQRHLNRAPRPNSNSAQFGISTSLAPGSAGHHRPHAQDTGLSSSITDHGSNVSSFRYDQPQALTTPISYPHPDGQDPLGDFHFASQGFRTPSELGWRRASSGMHMDGSFYSHGDADLPMNPGDQNTYTQNEPYLAGFEGQTSFDLTRPNPDYGSTTPSRPDYPLGNQNRNYQPIDPTELGQFISSVQNNCLHTGQDIPDRRSDPFSVAVYKRKRSG